jgi:hypothetical protein
MRKSMFLWIVPLCLFYPCVASADANLCNNTGRDIWATYGEQYTITDPSNDFVIGWYHIPSGQCAKPIVGDVCFWWAYVWNNCSGNVLFYADDAAGDQWGGWGTSFSQQHRCEVHLKLQTTPLTKTLSTIGIIRTVPQTASGGFGVHGTTLNQMTT